MIVLVYGSAFLGRSGYDAAGACAAVREGLARVEVGVAMATRLMDDDARYGDGMDGVFPNRAAQFMEGVLRSEERRVGKECRSRWSPYH